LRISLRWRVLTLVATINVAVFAVGLLYLSQLIATDRLKVEQEYSERVLYPMRYSIDEENQLRVAQILQWPFWDEFEDAIILDLNPGGVSLNPLGGVRRPPTFDRQLIEQGVARAVELKRAVPVADGLAMPVYAERGREPWGGCWIRVKRGVGRARLGVLLAPWFFASTLLLFLGTFSVLRRYVLKPVGDLARGARTLRDGRTDVRLDLPRHRDELADLITTFNNMAAEVRTFRGHLEEEVEEATRKAYLAEAAAMRQRRLAAMGELAAGIAHEINNPLGGMLNAVEVLDREDLDAGKRSRYHELLRGGLERIQGTVAKLLRLTPRDAKLEPISVEGPVRDAVDLVRHRAEKQGVEIVVKSDGAEHVVRGLGSELGQAVLNLLVNSLDALEERGAGGRIEVSLTRSGDEVVLCILDDGPGVEEERLERVADLFYSTKEVGRGSGLGLALVHGVADLHSGRVQLQNEPGGGFRVELVLPAAPSREAGG